MGINCLHYSKYQVKLKESCLRAPIQKIHVPYYDKNGAWTSTAIIVTFNESTGDKQKPTIFNRLQTDNYLGGKKWMLKWTRQ